MVAIARFRLGTILLLVAACVIGMSGTSGKRQTGSFHPTVISLEEASGTTSYDGESSHVLRIKFAIPSPPPGATGSTTGATATVTGTSTSTSTSTGGSGTTTISTDYTLAVDHPSYATASEFTVDGVSGSPIEETIYTGYDGMYYYPSGGIDVEALVGISPPCNCTLRISPASRTVNVYFIRHDRQSKVVSGSTVYGDVYQVEVRVYSISRTTADGVSVDTRLAFGQPDLGGALAGDANAPPQDVKFYGWTYRGGLFAGNADYLGANDLSGTARAEFYASALPTSGGVECETLTLLGLNPAPQFSAAPVLTGYYVSSAATSLTGETWADVWPITGSYSNSLTFASTGSSNIPANEYANFEFTGVGASKWVTVACTGEAAVVSGNTSMWEYFADANYISALTTLSSSLTSSVPFSDPAPRIWLAQVSSDNVYTWSNPPGW